MQSAASLPAASQHPAVIGRPSAGRRSGIERPAGLALDTPARRIASMALLLALGTAIYVAEVAFSPPWPLPGAKLGLANVVTLVVLALYGRRAAGLQAVARTVLGSLLTGTLLSPAFAFSLAGALAALAAMIAVLAVGGRIFSLVGVSVSGSVAHVTAQMAVAVLLVGHIGVLVELPYLTLVAVLTGCFTGLLAQLSVGRLVQVRLERDLL